MQRAHAQCGCGQVHEELLVIDEACRRARARVAPIAAIETVAIHQAVGRTLAETVSARHAMPRFDQSAMDGYAVAAASLRDGPNLLQVSARILAGAAPAPLLPATAARIFTGAPLPAGADAVVMQEQVTLRGTQVVIAGPVEEGSHVRRRGEDIAEDQALLEPGLRLDARHAGLLAAQGIAQVKVRCRPVVAVLSTGNELRQAGEPLPHGAIHDSNRPMLLALAAAAGCDTVDGGCLLDGAARLRERLLELSAVADLVVSSAGASVGDEDNAFRAAAACGQHVEALRIAMKPGKPAVVGNLGRAAYLGLPGNPVSAFVSWSILATAMLAGLQGRTWQRSPGFPVASASRYARKPGRTEFVPARLRDAGGAPAAELLGHGVSAHLLPLAAADGLVEIAAPHGPVSPGDLLRFHPFRDCCMP